MEAEADAEVEVEAEATLSPKGKTSEVWETTFEWSQDRHDSRVFNTLYVRDRLP